MATCGRGEFGAVTQIEQAEHAALTEALARHFVGVYGAPSVEAAMDTAREELDHMADLCEDHAPNTLLTLARELTDAGLREQYRVIEAGEADISQIAIHGALDEG